MNSVEDRVHAAMTAAGDLAAEEIRTAPPLRLPSKPAAGTRRGPAPRRWVRWGAPLTAAAAVAALAISLVLVKGAQNESVVSSNPTASASTVVPTGPGGVPRYYAALTQNNNGIVVGDSVTGKTLATLTPTARKSFKTSFLSITAADNDLTFVVSASTYPAASIKAPNGFEKATGTITWYVVRLAPGTAHPASLALLPIKPQTVHGSGELVDTASALSGSGQELAVTGFTASGGLAVRVLSVATGRLLHEWTTNDPSLTLADSRTKGLDGVSLTWIDGDKAIAVNTASATAPSKSKNPFLGFGSKNIVRELNVTGPSSGDLLADSKVVWDVQTWEYAATLLQACTGGRGGNQFISTDGTTFGCAAVTGPGTDPNLSFLTYPLTTGPSVAKQARIDYQVTQMAKKGVSTQQALWVSPSGDTIVGAWTTYAAATLEDAPNGLHIGAMSNGKFTPLRFPPGFDRAAQVATITW
ncbi:MAG TPA: hypothetical protein VFE59_30620 [Trebonia sp.]|nr:hypothetical protein [Trebonia sp.]